MIPNLNDKELFERIIKDRKLRINLAKQSHQWFFAIYFSHHIKYELAQFHKDFFNLTENEDVNFAVISAFRGSAKSTILTVSHSLWAIFRSKSKKHILILSQTQPQARLHLKNIKEELESNDLLKNDLGPFEERNELWNSSSIVLKNLGAKITAASLEQSIRGIRYRQHRPDMIICDDLEDYKSVKTRESRNKTYELLTGEVIPAGDLNTSIWVIGNLLHEDSTISRLDESMSGKDKFKIIKVPIIDDKGEPAWKGKFPTKQSIEELKSSIANPVMWMQEYMLKIVRDEEKVIDPKWIKYWEARPSRDHDDYRYTIISVDPAISEKETADFTAILTADVFGCGDKIKTYIHPVIFNKRFSANELINKIIDIYKIHGKRDNTKICIENVGFQGLIGNAIENQCDEYVEIEGIGTGGKDKRTRLMEASGSIERGEVLFPKVNSKELINQLTNFPLTKHDDLVDALSMLVKRVNKDRGVEGGFNGGLITAFG